MQSANHDDKPAPQSPYFPIYRQRLNKKPVLKQLPKDKPICLICGELAMLNKITMKYSKSCSPQHAKIINQVTFFRKS